MIFFYSIIEGFVKAVYDRFIPGQHEYKIQGYAEINNYQPGETIDNTSTRTWMTSVYSVRRFYSFVMSEITNQILERIILYGETGSSWIFKSFNRLTVTFSPMHYDRDIYLSLFVLF